MGDTFEACRTLQAELHRIGGVPEEGLAAESHLVLAKSLTRGTRGYIEKVANQINGCYERGWFDGCAVMIRRLVETLIIEVYEHKGVASEIKDPNSGDFLFLRDLIGKLLSSNHWNIGRLTRRMLPMLKDVGDKSAHSRRYNANKQDIDSIKGALRDVVQELLYLANLK